MVGCNGTEKYDKKQAVGSFQPMTEKNNFIKETA
jgi:hypothetical protein